MIDKTTLEQGRQTDEELALRVRAIESLLLEKGILSDGLVDAVAAAYETDIGPLNGAHVVARAWTDPDFKERLLSDGAGAISRPVYFYRMREGGASFSTSFF